jgi:glycosyltransferase involved in cell wall biosynthesis
MNADMRDRLIALGAPPDRTDVVPMGADVDTVRRVGAGVPSEPGRLLFVGRLVEKKGCAVLFDAVKLLADRPGWSLVVVGDGPLRASLQERAAGLPVTFLGTLSRVELATEYARSEVLVVPSVTAASGDQDGLPVVLLEGMAAGCAIVASRIAGLDVAITDGTSGVLVPAGDAAALAAELGRLLDDPARRRRLGAAASARADLFSVAAVGARYRQLLRSVAGLAEPPIDGPQRDQPTPAAPPLH